MDLLNKTIKKNFEIISNWNGTDNLNNFLIDNPLKDNIHYTRINTNDKEMINLLKYHPIINKFIDLGFNYDDILKCYDIEIDEYLSLIKFFIHFLNQNELNEYNQDLDWLIRKNNSTISTNGELIAKLIKKSSHDTGEIKKSLNGTFRQLLCLHLFFDKQWYKEMKYGLNNGSQFDRYSFFVLFFNDYINLDIMGCDHDLDINERSNIIFNKIINKENICRRLTLTDGHGRLIKNILDKIINFNYQYNPNEMQYYLEFINNLKIRVCELKYDNHIWHENILPVNINNNFKTCINDNILSPNELNGIVEDNGVIYFNFNKLTNQDIELVNVIKIFKDNNLENDVIISFYNNDNNSIFNELINLGMIKINDENNDYLTLIFP